MKTCQLQETIHDIAKRQAEAFTNGNLDGFMEPFDLDIVSDYYMRRWFNGYAVKVIKPCRCDFIIADTGPAFEGKSNYNFTFYLQYAGFAAETATFKNVVVQKEEQLSIVESTVFLKLPQWHDPYIEMPLLLVTESFYPALGKQFAKQAVVRLYNSGYANFDKPVIIAGTPGELLEQGQLSTLGDHHAALVARTSPPEIIVWGTNEDEISRELKAVLDNKVETGAHLPQVLTFRKQVEETLPSRWWEAGEIVEICQDSVDVLKASLYSRAAPSSARFRNTHPELDSAAIMADMMTHRACKLVYSFGSNDLATHCKKVNVFAQKVMTTRNYENLRRENHSYFPARELSLQPLLSIDEIFAYWERDKSGPAEVGCSEVASFYVTMYRLGGIAPQNIYIIVQPFHYLSLFLLPKGNYIVSVNEVIPMNRNKLYGDTDVTRVVTPAFFLDNSGQTNLTDAAITDLNELLRNNVPIFTIPEATEKVNTMSWDVEPNYTIHNCSYPHEMYKAIKKHVFTMSHTYPASPFTWAKYGYQTLLVNQPQAYLIWSLKAVECKEFVKSHSEPDSILHWLAKTDNRSIFEEPERIMTADQVIRHYKAAPKDRALFLCAMLKLNDDLLSGGLVITDESSYAALGSGDKQRIIDCGTLTPVRQIKGKIIVAFDEKDCYAPSYIRNYNCPSWLSNII
jgi:hypothetical protein